MDFFCPSCKTSFILPIRDKGWKAKFCPFCGSSIDLHKAETLPLQDLTDKSQAEQSISFVQGHFPEKNDIQFTVGSYQIIQNIGKGGMGEVFLAYDTTCGRRIALKRIRTDLVEHLQMQNRFLKEARITSQLTHPAIIPIYTINSQDQIYYTMPFVEGNTLKQILNIARNKERRGEKSDQSIGSIPYLIRIFLSICQAIAYAHSKGVLHRDIKPENVIVGKYGEVLILDWGLAQLIQSSKEESFESVKKYKKSSPHMTYLGKVVGTISHMAPERAKGKPANVLTDIYSLGVILYNILTLRLPFRRGTLKEFRENIAYEVLHNPTEVAPYRDVPRMLSQIAIKCLGPIDQRYQSVDELIHDLESYIEGRSEWFKFAELNIHNKNDWEFQENILIAEHIAITRGIEMTDWVSLMISKISFAENTKIEARVRIGEKGLGLGFLLSVPEIGQRIHLNDGYCLWLSSDLGKNTKLLRSTVEVIHAPEIQLIRHEWYRVRIEKIDQNIYFYLNDFLQFSYISHLPLAGTHIGILSRDADFVLTPIRVYSGSLSIKVNCLAVPDAFLARKDFDTALSEYRRIGYSFPGTAEGREGMFRAGITFLEKAKESKDASVKEQLYDQALEEFTKLHKTPGAPLEYLGKALVYQTLNDFEEEIKCFEMAYRRYPHHPLLPVLQEQIVSRMQESSRQHRKATYYFILLAIQHLPKAIENSNVQKLFNSLMKNWESLPFILEDLNSDKLASLKNYNFENQLAFWLAKPFVLVEIQQIQANLEQPSNIIIDNALFSLIELGCYQLAEIEMASLEQASLAKPFSKFLKIMTKSHYISLEDSFNLFWEQSIEGTEIEPLQFNVLIFLIEKALDSHQISLIFEIIPKLEKRKISELASFRLDCNVIWAHLLDKNWKAAGDLLHKYPLELINQETTLLNFLYGCWLMLTEGKDIAQIHFAGVLEVSFPRTWTLGSHFINGQISSEHSWFQKAFMWEKRQMYRQLALYYHCAEDQEMSMYYHNLQSKEYVKVQI